MQISMNKEYIVYVHLFLFLRLREKINSHSPIPDIKTWEKISSEGGWVFNGMQKRLLTDSSILTLDVVAVAENDFAFYASLAFAIILFAALSVSLFPKMILGILFNSVLK